MQGKVIYDWW